MDEVKKQKAWAQIKACFPDPDYFGEIMGYELEHFEEGKVTMSLKIQQKHLSLAGVTHGGAIASLMDGTMGVAVMSTLQKGERCSTIEFKINYISPVVLGETIFCDSKIKYRGRSHAVLEVHVYREAGKDVAVGLGTFNIYS